MGLSARPHAAAAKTAATSAGSLHRRAVSARPKPASGVLDLSQPVTNTAHHSPAAPPKTTTHERQLAHLNDRLAKAKQVERSPLVDKFPRTRLAEPTPTLVAPLATSRPKHQATTPEAATPELPAHVSTAHQAMAQLPRLAPPPNPAPPSAAPSSPNPWRPHLKLAHSRVAATVAAIAIMGGYIWVQNYPKFALQNASNKAGVTASLPSYLPSSYRLSRTDTSEGLVTLNFHSPSVNDALKIAQHRTSWDSSSLLDNFVAKNTDDYATVQGQGLTIYLFNNNHATWVNHGVWYSIEGASRLSREQILKIAYSL